MNTSPVNFTPGVRQVPTGTQDKRRRNNDAEQFRRALQQHDNEAEAEAEMAGQQPAPAKPTPRALQRQLPASRRDQDTTARHVDVIA